MTNRKAPVVRQTPCLATLKTKSNHFVQKLEEISKDTFKSFSKLCLRVYLDYNATTPIDPRVVEAMSKSLSENWHNPSSQSRKGKLAKTLINEARGSLATMINAENASDILFMSGGTEANNIVFYSMLEFYKQLREKAAAVNTPVAKVPHIIVSKIEHDSVKLIADSYKAQQLAGELWPPSQTS